MPYDPNAIINTHDQCRRAGGDRIFLSYHAKHSVLPAAWRVCRMVEGREMVTDPRPHDKRAWYDHGNMSFSAHGPARTGRAAALAEALAWIKARYGKADFVRNRMGDYVERDVNVRFPIPKRTIPAAP